MTFNASAFFPFYFFHVCFLVDKDDLANFFGKHEECQKSWSRTEPKRSKFRGKIITRNFLFRTPWKLPVRCCSWVEKSYLHYKLLEVSFICFQTIDKLDWKVCNFKSRKKKFLKAHVHNRVSLISRSMHKLVAIS